MEEIVPASTRTDSGRSLESFTCFPQLPRELQLTIWEKALPGPRLIPVENSGSGYRIKPGTHPLPSSILHTCHISREVALKRYKVAATGQRTGFIYLDFETDVLFFDPDWPGITVRKNSAIFNQFRNVAFACDYYTGLLPLESNQGFWLFLSILRTYDYLFSYESVQGHMLMMEDSKITRHNQEILRFKRRTATFSIIRKFNFS